MEVSHFLNPYHQAPFFNNFDSITMQTNQTSLPIKREPFFTPRKITFDEDNEKKQKIIDKQTSNKGFKPLKNKKSEANDIYIEEDVKDEAKQEEQIKQEDQKVKIQHQSFIEQPKSQIFSQDLQNLGKDIELQKKDHITDSDSDAGDLFEETTIKPPKILSNQLDQMGFEQNTKKEKQMDEKINNALKIDNTQIQIDQDQEELEEEEEELNSKDDVSDYEGEVKTDDRLLLAYYEKSTRKKDKRKILLKDCVLRLNGTDFIFPTAKGDFTWVAAQDR